MKKTGWLILVAVLMAGPALAAASDKTDVMAVVHQWVDGFNKGDRASALAACADETSIIDDIPPHEWHGSGACAKWFDAFDGFVKKNSMTDARVTLGKPRHLWVSEDAAYVVVTATLIYQRGGKPMKETGSTVAMALHKGASGWRISGWSWANGLESAVKSGS